MGEPPSGVWLVEGPHPLGGSRVPRQCPRDRPLPQADRRPAPVRLGAGPHRCGDGSHASVCGPESPATPRRVRPGWSIGPAARTPTRPGSRPRSRTASWRRVPVSAGARRGQPRLCALDPMTGAVIRSSKTTATRYERSRPGELVHMDVKSWAASPTAVAGALMAAPPAAPAATGPPGSATTTCTPDR
jgi:hypothetical protein